jgi:hypothetical protein
MKRKRFSISALNAYNEGYKRGIDIALANKELTKINPYSPLFNRSCWEGFGKGLKDGFLQGVKQREQQQAYQRLKELSALKEGKSDNKTIER